MKKTLITLLGVLVLCIVMVSCQNNPIESEEVSVSFATAVSKALNESLNKVDTSNTDVKNYYWDYWVDTVDPDKSTVEFKNFAFTGKNTTEAKKEKGLGNIPGLTRGIKYYFGLKGYSDAERTTLVWEGYTRESEDQTSDYKSVRLGSSITVVKIHVWATGNGQIRFDIHAPLDDVQGNNDNVNDNYKKYESSYFRISWYQVDDVENKDFVEYKPIDAGFETYYNYSTRTGKTSDTEVWMSYVSPKDSDLKAGVYLMTVTQMLVSNDTEVPARKQVLLVNIVPGAVTTVSGSLDSTIGVSIDWDASKYMKVIFHSAYEEGTIQPLGVKAGSTALTTESDLYTTTGSDITFTPSIPDKGVVNWYVNGVALEQSVLASLYVGNTSDTDDGKVDGYVTAGGEWDDAEPAVEQFANPFQSYAYIDGNNLTFYRGGKASTLPEDNDGVYDGYDRNRYIFTAVFIGDDIDKSTSFSFTVGFTGQPLASEYISKD